MPRIKWRPFVRRRLAREIDDCIERQVSLTKPDPGLVEQLHAAKLLVAHDLDPEPATS